MVSPLDFTDGMTENRGAKSCDLNIQLQEGEEFNLTINAKTEKMFLLHENEHFNFFC